MGGVRLKGPTNAPTKAYCTHLKVRNDNYIMKVIFIMKTFVFHGLETSCLCLYHSSVLLPVQYSVKLKENLGI